MIVDIITQVEFEDGGNIEAWAIDNNYQVRYCHMYRGDKLPETEKVDFVAIMGGPMGVNDQKKYPWLKEEKAFIETMLKYDKSVIGICLGSQLIASVLGSSVGPNSYCEIGWGKVKLEEYAGKLAVLPNEFIAFHWHNDRFEIPQSAIKLASSDGCDNQAFEYGNSVLGLQFHLEYSLKSIEMVMANCPEQMVCKSPYVQSKDEILSGADNIDINKKLLYRLLDRITG